MDDQIETREFKVDSDIVDPLTRELESRLRLRFAVKKPRWWSLSSDAVFTITGPRFALEPLPEIIKKLEEDAFVDRQW